MSVAEAPVDEPALVAPGEYSAVYVRHKAGVVFRTPKLRVDFRLVEHPDIVLQRWYRIEDFRGGRIRAGRHSDAVREISAVLGRRVRHDRIPVSALADIAVGVVVTTVTKDSSQRAIAAVNRYSVIARLLERVM